MQNIPVIFIHNGNSAYLKHVVAHNRAFNRENDIYFLGDESTSKLPFVRHYNKEQYFTSANGFEKIYEHMSSNPYEFELFCFQRWFIINEFVREQGLTHFLCLDSDVLLYCNVNEIFSRFLEFDFTVSQQHSPHIALFSGESLSRFCDYITTLYTQPEYLNRFRQNYGDFQAEQRQGGICDMFAFALYQDDVSGNVKELSDISEEYFFDGNINEADGFEMKSGVKKIYWKNNLPFAKIADTGSFLRLYGLHFQGGAKSKIYKYILNGNLKRPGIVSSVRSFFIRKTVLFS